MLKTRRSALTLMIGAGTLGIASGAFALNTSPKVRASKYDYQLSFSEYPVGTIIKDEFWQDGIAPVRFENLGQIAEDGSNPTSPVLVPLSQHQSLKFSFAAHPVPDTLPGAVSRLRFDIGFLDQPHDIRVTLYEAQQQASQIILAKRNRDTGIVTFKFKDLGTRIGFVWIDTLGNEPAGWGIDNLMFDKPVPL
jgi:hypothetical protein